MAKETYENLYKSSLVQRAKGNFVSAFEYAQKAYSINDSNVEIIMNCAFLAEQLNLTEYLVFFMERACLLKPDNEQYFLKLAFLYKNNKNNIGALQCFERCLAINNKNFLALINICEISIICKNYNLAHKYANLSLEAATKNEEFKRTHLKLSNIYQNQKNWRAALKEVRKSMKYLPVTHYDYSTLACICWEYVSYSLAVKFFFKALELCPNELDYLYNIGNCYLFQNETDKAINVTNEVLNKNPEHVLALRLLTFIWLIQKQYEQAMKTYPILLSPKVLTKLNQLDNKINNVNYIANCSRYFELHWDRQNIKNKTIFIYNDAGLGDSIMFSRFIPLIENQAGKVIIEINSNLYDIYKRSFKKSEIILETKEGFYGKYDYSTSFMCLFYNMERDFSHIPNSQGWLCADEKKVEYFSKLDKFKSEKKKIGFFWRGNPNIMPNRSIDISFFSKIFEMENMQFYSLDIVKKDEITKKIFEEYNITDCSEYIKNVDDTAAIIKNLDLVITIDSSIVHLAGALGVKTYLLLPNNPEWRWFKDDDKTIWYDSVKIFKQTKQGHWQSVIDRLKNQLLA